MENTRRRDGRERNDRKSRSGCSARQSNALLGVGRWIESSRGARRDDVRRNIHRKRQASCMAWTLKDGPRRIADGPDDSRWLYTLVAGDGTLRCTLLRITGTAMSMGADRLPPQVAALRESHGRSLIDQLLGWAEPPREIEGNSGWINLRFDRGAAVRL